MAKWTEEQKEKARQAYKDRTGKVETIDKVDPGDPEIVRNYKDVGTLPVRGNGMEMDYEGLFQTMNNIIMILPPNKKVNGRHSIEDISALCGYRITEEMWEKLYEDKEAA